MRTEFVTARRAVRGRCGEGDSGNSDEDQRPRYPVLLTVDETAELLRTTRRAIYAMVERHQLPAVIRIRRRHCFARTTCYTGWTRSARHRRRSERR